MLVAGSVGPLGLRIEPLGKVSREEAQAAFREQIEVLAAEGVDLILLETFGYIDELHQAVLAARAAAPGLPIVAQVTIDEDGNALDGTDPETFGARLTDFGVDVVGCNCSVGPAAMLDTMERLRRVTSLPLWRRSPTPACRATWKDATSISARPSTWPAMRASSWPPASPWSADAAAPLPSTSRR